MEIQDAKACARIINMQASRVRTIGILLRLTGDYFDHCLTITGMRAT
jgi:hypothetical protein